MTFTDLVSRIENILNSHSVRRIPDNEALREHAAWRCGDVYAFIFHLPEDVDLPAHLHFASVTGGAATAVQTSTDVERLQLSGRDADSAASRILIWRNVRFEATISHDALGPLQKPILESVQLALPGALVGIVPLPNSYVGLSIEWPGFEGRSELERQNLVIQAIERVQAGASKRISVALANTPEEMKNLMSCDE